MKLDPWNHKENYLRWKEKVREKGIPHISKENSDLTPQYVFDMENGINIAVGSIKGSRSYGRLLSLKTRLIFFSRKFKEFYQLNKVTDISEDQLMRFFSNIKKGIIKRGEGKTLRQLKQMLRFSRHFGIGG